MGSVVTESDFGHLEHLYQSRFEIAVAVDRFGMDMREQRIRRRCWGSERRSHETLTKYQGDVKTAHDERGDRTSAGWKMLPNWWNKAGSAG